MAGTATIEATVARLLTEGRVFVKWSTPENVCAAVRDDGGVHDVHLHGGRWSCTCQARVTCSHLTAVMKVTVPAVVATPTPTLDELLGPEPARDYAEEPF
jgi:hypothetical protein